MQYRLFLPFEARLIALLKPKIAIYKLYRYCIVLLLHTWQWKLGKLYGYNYERHMCPGCALACFRLWLRHCSYYLSLYTPLVSALFCSSIPTFCSFKKKIFLSFIIVMKSNILHLNGKTSASIFQCKMYITNQL